MHKATLWRFGDRFLASFITPASGQPPVSLTFSPLGPGSPWRKTWRKNRHELGGLGWLPFWLP